MRTPAISQSRFARLGNLPAVRVTILYETLEAAIRAKALMDCVKSDMHAPAKFELEFWRFDWLGTRSCCNVALSTARRSVAVIISTCQATCLPVEMEQWLKAWAVVNEGDEDDCSALIALHPDDLVGRASYRPVHDRLQRAAWQKGVDFFCEFFEPGAAGAEVNGRFQANERTSLFSKPKDGMRWQYVPIRKTVTQVEKWSPPQPRIP